MYKILITSSDDNAVLNDIAKVLTIKKLSPCSNIIQDVKSFYLWDNKFIDENESLLIIKCEVSDIKKIEKIIYQKHNYEIPEIISIDFNIISKEYKNWFNKDKLQ